MNTREEGYAVVASLMFSAAVGLGGVGAAVSFYHSNDLLNSLDIPVQVAPPRPTPTPTVSFMPVITQSDEPNDIIPDEEVNDGMR